MPKMKCDCCGKMFTIDKLTYIEIPEKEFDGSACNTCLEELKQC